MATPGPGDHDRTRRDYDAVAATYAERIGGELAGKPLDRALLVALAEEAGGPPAGEAGTARAAAVVADLGCGPGHVTGWLAGLGVRAVGVDLSPAMVALARDTHPGAEFREGDLLQLPARDAEFDAAVAFYSVIHLPGPELVPAFAEAHRVLRPGGVLLVAFHLGADTRHLSDWWGHPVDLDFHFLPLATVIAALEAAGLAVEFRLEREPYPGEAETRRAYVLARKAR